MLQQMAPQPCTYRQHRVDSVNLKTDPMKLGGEKGGAVEEDRKGKKLGVGGFSQNSLTSMNCSNNNFLKGGQS